MPEDVVITRPAAQAGPLAARLTERLAGACTVHVFPLLEIQPLPDTAALDAALARLTDYALVAFVSPNAIDAAFARMQSAWPASVGAAVVGEGSRQALARHGLTEASATIISPRNPVRTDSETLLHELDLPALAGRKVLIVRGESGRELLAERLREAGVHVAQVAAYRRLVPALDDTRRAQLLKLLAEPTDWVITSSEALRNLQQQVVEAAGSAGWQQMQGKTLIIPHMRIAETARALGFRHIIETGSGDDALCAAIQSRP